MERKYTLTLVVILLIAIGAFAYLFTQGSDPETEQTHDPMSDSSPEEESGAEPEPPPHDASYIGYLPEVIASLPEDFYPAGLTRDDILEMLPHAVEKTGVLQNESWSGVILVTGDTKIEYLTIEPGTVILVAENQDDQRGGEEGTVDPVNPHEFLGADYAMTHTSIQVIERLTAKGTPENPIIFTSTAREPWLADWDHLIFRSGVLEYAFVEHCWGVAVDSSEVSVSHCVIRNVLQQGLMFGHWPEAGIHGEGSLSPNVTYNFMYNVGHMAVQSFFSDPIIAHNVFIQKHTGDPELYAYLSEGENGALDIHGGNGTITHNFLSSGYTPDFEEKRPFGGSPGIVITEATAPELSHNTITGNLIGIEVQGGMPVINDNDIHGNIEGNFGIRSVYAEPGRENTLVAYDRPLDCTGNWWGTSEMREIMAGMRIEEGIEIEIDPVSQSEVPGNGPDWGEFEWLYTP